MDSLDQQLTDPFQLLIIPAGSNEPVPYLIKKNPTGFGSGGGEMIGLLSLLPNQTWKDYL